MLYMCGTDVFIVYADVFCKLAEMVKGKISIPIVSPVDIFLACAGSFVFVVSALLVPTQTCAYKISLPRA